MSNLKYTYPKQVLQKVLKSIKENEDGFKFEGEIINGKIEGLYSSFLFQNNLTRTVNSILKITGNYHLDNGELSIKGKPSVIFYFSIAIPLIAIIYFFWSLFTQDEILLEHKVSLLSGIGFTLVFTVLYFVESWWFKNDLETKLNYAFLEDNGSQV